MCFFLRKKALYGCAFGCNYSDSVGERLVADCLMAENFKSLLSQILQRTEMISFPSRWWTAWRRCTRLP